MISEESKISIVCAWYNRYEYLETSIHSLANQKYKNYDVIIVNDGSTDQRVRDYLEKIDNPKIKIFHIENKGFVNAINYAISQSNADFIAIHGAGDESFTDRLKEQVNNLKSSNDIKMVGCRFEVEIVRSACSFRYVDKHSQIEFTLSDVLKGVHKVTHGSMMFRRGDLLEIGGYRSIFKYGQDRDLFIRLLESGGRGVILDSILYRRKSIEGESVSANKHSLLIQQTLTSFAVQCYYDRLQYHRDLIDMYGHYALAFRKKSQKLSIYMSKLALISLLVDDRRAANYFINMAKLEHQNPYVYAVRVIVFLSLKHAFSMNLLRVIAKRFSRYNSWISKK